MNSNCVYGIENRVNLTPILINNHINLPHCTSFDVSNNRLKLLIHYLFTNYGANHVLIISGLINSFTIQHNYN